MYHGKLKFAVCVSLLVLAAGCSGTSIYLITDEQKAQSVAEVLKKVFTVPGFQ